MIFTKTISYNGYIVGYLEKKIGNFNFYEEVPKKIKNGEIKFKEYTKEGLENAAQLLVDVLKGTNDGKAVLKVAEQ